MSGASHIQLRIDGQTLRVAAGTSVAAALAHAGTGCARLSVRGEARAPLCGMGICHECRVRVGGCTVLACQTLCTEGMQVETGTAA